MSEALPGILSRIVQTKRKEIAQLAPRLSEWERLAAERATERRAFGDSLRAHAPAIIAEIKQASPSKGLITDAFDPPAIARDYEAGGAAALSVLTDAGFFRGSMQDLAAARAAVALPVLRKDFVLDEVQVAEAAAGGADAVLLIAAILPLVRLRELRLYAAGFGLDALVEAHDERELDLALASGAEIVGVNNRDLRSFQVSLETSLRLAGRIPPHIVKVSESGISTASDVRTLRQAGFDAFLVGETLMKAPDRRAALRTLVA